MTKLALAFLTLAFSSLASAKTLTYTVDYEAMTDIDKNVLDNCGYPESFRVDSAAPIGPELIKQTFSSDAKITIENIQSTSGTLAGGDRNEAYLGEYREKVYLVKQVIKGIYEPGIFTRVQINTYGSTSAPTGITISSELLNHRYSAELGEGADCGEIWFRLN